MRGLILFTGSALLTAAAIIPSNVDAQSSPKASAMTNPERGAFLDDAALRALLVDSYVTPQGRGDDGPGEYFRANGIYQRGTDWGIVFEGLFEIRDAAVCVRGEGSAPICRRVVANGDGTSTFINIADGTSATKAIISRTSVAMMNERRGTPLTGAALRALLVDAAVADFRTGQLADGSMEFFRANGSYQRRNGRAVAAEGTFEIRDDMVCVGGSGVPPLCRRVLARGDGTYTFIDTADGTSTRMTVTRTR